MAVEGGREEHRLAVARKPAHELVDLRLEAHVEHAVGLVEDERAHLGQIDEPSGRQIFEPPGVATRMCAPLMRLACERIGTPPYAAATRRPLATASASKASVTWAASSRVGTSTSAEGRPSAGVVRSTIGSAKARVLPEPVGERTRTSSPSSASGRTSSWMLKRLMDRAAASAATTGADTPSSRKDWFDMKFDSLRVRDLPTSKHPKEEREAHLTGRRDCRSRSHSSSDTLGRCPRTSPNR